MKISNDKKTVSALTTYVSNSCYGSRIIDSTIKNKTYKWKLKNMGNPSDVYIGIDNASAKSVNSRFDFTEKKAYYSYNLFTGHLSAWEKMTQFNTAPKCKEGDIIIMILSFGLFGATLKAQINDGQIFTISNNITRQKGLKYRLAVAMYVKDSSIKILD